MRAANAIFDMPKGFRNSENTPAILRAVQVLEWFADNPDGASLTLVATSLQLPISTTYETLRTLVNLRLLNKDATNGRYSMGVRVLEIGMSYLSRTNLVQAFHTAAGDATRVTGETVQLAVRDGREVLHIAEVRGTRSMRIVADIGRRLPCHTSSTGKALLACLTDTEVMQLYRNAVFVRMTRYSLDSVPALLKELRTVRRRGYAVDAQETYEGIQCVGAAVRRPGGAAVAAVSVAMLYSPTNVQRIREVADAVRSAAAAISRHLGLFWPDDARTNGSHEPGASRGGVRKSFLDGHGTRRRGAAS